MALCGMGHLGIPPSAHCGPQSAPRAPNPCLALPARGGLLHGTLPLHPPSLSPPCSPCNPNHTCNNPRPPTALQAVGRLPGTPVQPSTPAPGEAGQQQAPRQQPRRSTLGPRQQIAADPSTCQCCSGTGRLTCAHCNGSGWMSRGGFNKNNPIPKSVVNSKWTAMQPTIGWRHFRVIQQRKSSGTSPSQMVFLLMQASCDPAAQLWVNREALRDRNTWAAGWLQRSEMLLSTDGIHDPAEPDEGESASQAQAEGSASQAQAGGSASQAQAGSSASQAQAQTQAQGSGMLSAAAAADQAPSAASTETQGGPHAGGDVAAAMSGLRRGAGLGPVLRVGGGKQVVGAGRGAEAGAPGPGAKPCRSCGGSGITMCRACDASGVVLIDL